MTIDYKETLQLPYTAFPMKANLSMREPEILKKWEDLDLYHTLEAQQNKTPKPSFILSDGPPYANGPIHIGHAVNKILKDFIVKAKRFSGFYAPFVPGWDCHGLPIELNVEKKIGKPNVTVDAKTFRQQCRHYVDTQIELQKSGFKRLGILGDWENPYITMHYRYEADTIRALAIIIANGHLQQGYKPVHWCIECRSALAEAEVEYQDKLSSSIYVAFPMTLSSRETKFPGVGQHIFVVIWTTTPWTLPANEAVAIHADHTYVLLKNKQTDKCYVIAKALQENVCQALSWTDVIVLAECPGRALAGAVLEHPFYVKTVPLLFGDHVTLEHGTGCVHIAPAHGQEDYVVGKQNGLQFENPVGIEGCYLPGTPLFGGEHVFKVNDQILACLAQRQYLLGHTQIRHSYPHCWRHKCPLIFRSTVQWFISMDAKALREKTLSEIAKVQWIPEWGQARIDGMINDRPDWCVSRQRTWGVPMSFFVHRETGHLHPDTLTHLEMVAQAVEKKGVEAWYELSAEDFGVDSTVYEKSVDTLDVWFDSGVSHYCVLEQREGLHAPADLYLEGSDQHRGWFQSSILTGVAMNNRAPYRQVLTHGFTVDAQGRKMSKSLGNVVAPEKVVETLGADVLRLWVAATDYRAEMVVSDDILKQTSDIYRRIRNTARFLLANLNGFDPVQHLVPFEQLIALDAYILLRAMNIQAEVISAYENYQFHSIYQLVHHFCSVELGGFYLDIIKDRQYTGKAYGLPRLSAQTVLYYIAEALVRWIAPILSFTAEEIWQYLPGTRAESVLLTEWYEFPTPVQKTEYTEAFWAPIIAMRDVVNQALEKARVEGKIGSALEAEVFLYGEVSKIAPLCAIEQELRFVLITSSVMLKAVDRKPDMASETGIPGLWIVIESSTHLKCARCWHRCPEVGNILEYPGICNRCVENVAGSGEKRVYA